jgi:hypothetical protein
MLAARCSSRRNGQRRPCIYANEAAAIAVRTAIMLIQEADPYAFGAVYSPRS